MEGSGRFGKRSKLPPVTDLIRRKAIKGSDHFQGQGKKYVGDVLPRHDPAVQQTSRNKVKSPGCASVALQNLSLAYGNEDDFSDSSSDESSPNLSASNQDSDQQNPSQTTTTIAIESCKGECDSATAHEFQGSEQVSDESKLIHGQVEVLAQHREDSASPAALPDHLDECAGSHGDQETAQELEIEENSLSTDERVVSPGAVAELAEANQDNLPHSSKGDSSVTESVPWSQHTDGSNTESGHYRETPCSDLQAHPVYSKQEESAPTGVAPQLIESSITCPASGQPTEPLEGLAQIEVVTDVGAEQDPAIPAVEQQQVGTDCEEVPVEGIRESQPVQDYRPMHSDINRDQLSGAVDECVDQLSALTPQQASKKGGPEETRMTSLQTDTNVGHSEAEHYQYDAYSHDRDGHCQQEDGYQYSVVGGTRQDSHYQENHQFQEHTSQSQAYSQALQTQSYTDDSQSLAHSQELQTQSYTDDSQSQAYSQALQTQSYNDDSQSLAYSQELQTQSYTDDSQSQAYSQELQTQSYTEDSQSQAHSQELQSQSYTDDSQSQAYSYDPQTQSYYQGSQPQTQAQPYSEDLQSQAYTQSYTGVSQSQAYSHDQQTEAYSHGLQTAAYPQHSAQSQVYSHNTQPGPHSQDPQSLAYSETQVDSQSRTTHGPPAQDDQLYTEAEIYSHTPVHAQLQASSQTQSYSQVQDDSQTQTYSQDQQTQANSQFPVHSQDPQAHAHFQDSHSQANSQPQVYSQIPQAPLHSPQDPQSHAIIQNSQSQSHSYNPQVHEYSHDSQAQSYSQDQVYSQSQPYSKDPQYEAQYDQQAHHSHSSHGEGGYTQQGSYAGSQDYYSGAGGSQDYYSDTGDPNYHPYEGQQHSADYSEQGPGASHTQQNRDHSQPQYGAHDSADPNRGHHSGQGYPSHGSLPPSNHPGYGRHCEESPEPRYYGNVPPRSWDQPPEPHSEYMGARDERWQRGYGNPPPAPPPPPPTRYLHSPSQNDPPGHYTRDFRRDDGNFPPQQSGSFRDPNYRDSPSWGGRYGQHPSYQRDRDFSRPSKPQQYTNPPYHSPNQASPSSSRSTASPSVGIQSPVAVSPSQQEHPVAASSLEKGQASLNSPQRSSQPLKLETASSIPLQDPRRSHDPEGKQHYLKNAKYSGLGNTSLRKRTPMLKYGNPKRKEPKSKGPQIIAPHHSTAPEEPSSSKVVVKGKTGKDSDTLGRVKEGASSSWEGPKPLAGFKIPKLKGAADKASKGKSHLKVSQEEKPPVKKEKKEQQNTRPVTIVPKTVTVVPKTVTIVPKTHTRTKPSKPKAATKTTDRVKKVSKGKEDMASLLSSIDPTTLQVLASSIQQALSKASTSSVQSAPERSQELSHSAEASPGELTMRSSLQVKDELTVTANRNHSSKSHSDDADDTSSSQSTHTPSTDLGSMMKRDETAAVSIRKDTAVQTMLQRVTKPSPSVKEEVPTRQISKSAAVVDDGVKSRKPATVVATILSPKTAETAVQTSSSSLPALLKNTEEKKITAVPMNLDSEQSPPSSLPVVIHMSPKMKDIPRESGNAAECQASDGSGKVSANVLLQSDNDDTDQVDTYPIEGSPSAKSSEYVRTSAVYEREKSGCEQEKLQQNEAFMDEGTEVDKLAQSQSDFSFEFFNSKFLYKEYNLRRTRKRTDSATPESKKRKTVLSDTEHSPSKAASEETASGDGDLSGSEISSKKRERSPDTDDELPKAKKSMDSVSAEKSPSPVTRIVSVDLTRIAPTISRKVASKKANSSETDSDATENDKKCTTASTNTPTLRSASNESKTKKPGDKDVSMDLNIGKKNSTKVAKNEIKASREVQPLSVFDFVDDSNDTTHNIPVLPSAQASPQKAASKGIKPSTKELNNQPDKKRLLKKAVACTLCKLKGNVSDLGFLFGPYRYTQDQSATSEGTSKSEDEAKPAKTLVSSELWVHEDCAVWAPGVCLVGRQLKGLVEAASDGEMMVCSSCKKSGATLCCMRSSRGCKMVYHYPCAKDAGCSLSQEQFLIACPKHKEGK